PSGGRASVAGTVATAAASGTAATAASLAMAAANATLALAAHRAAVVAFASARMTNLHRHHQVVGLVLLAASVLVTMLTSSRGEFVALIAPCCRTSRTCSGSRELA